MPPLQISLPIMAAVLSWLALTTSTAAAAPQRLILDERQPSKSDTDAATASSPIVGSVIFTRGSQVVAEIFEETMVHDVFVVRGEDYRRKGLARVVQVLRSNTYRLQGVGTSLREGDRLYRETELEAAARVLGGNDRASYLAFLERFPKSEYRPRIARELFRLQMKQEFPSHPGSSVSGELQLGETVERNIPRDKVQIMLDRFVIALSAEDGRYRIDGLPELDEAVAVNMTVRDPKFRLKTPVTITLPAGKLAEIEQNLSLSVTPTVLRGQVRDEHGEPLGGAEVWTAPYSTEYLTDENGNYEISRIKKVSGNAGSVSDEPLFGGEYEVYARRSGYSVERVTMSAESFTVNDAPVIRLAPQDPRKETLPELALDLRVHLQIDPKAFSVPAGSVPMINP